MKEEFNLGQGWQIYPPIYCRKCGTTEVEKEGDMCDGCASDGGGGNDSETAKEDER